jgi:hypothetical protein
MAHQDRIWKKMGWVNTQVLWGKTSGVLIPKEMSNRRYTIPDFAIYRDETSPFFLTEISLTEKFDHAKTKITEDFRVFLSLIGVLIIDINELRLQGQKVKPDNDRSELTGLSEKEELEAFQKASNIWHEKAMKRAAEGYRGSYEPFVWMDHEWIGHITATCHLFVRINNEIIETTCVSIVLNLYVKYISE